MSHPVLAIARYYSTRRSVMYCIESRVFTIVLRNLKSYFPATTENRLQQTRMSLRPRPVTATVTKPKWMEPQVTRPRSRSLESNGSTASLTSVLDHDSYESLGESEDELHTEEGDQYTRSDIDNRLHEDVKNKCIISESSSQYTEQKDPQLSSWEKWLIQKSKSERKKQREIRRAKKQEKTIKEKEKQDKEMKEKKAEERRKEWLEQKSYEEKLRKKNDRQRKRLEKDLKEDEKRRIAVKAEGNYDEWMERKKKEEKDLKKEQKRRQQEVEHAKKKQQIDAQHKYEEWLHRSKNRPKSVPNSFGYTSGKLTGM
ncbi:CCDC34 [Mytilus edulis]|uniref:CCDC34 n=1 Tax=Mytilus edulis TaxID=6550 RepID=A0A8S3TL77_MYTED|nr:CCDC34 [Mytilus edulis]